MAISYPAINVGLDNFFGDLRPYLNKYGRLGAFDFDDTDVGLITAENGTLIPVPFANAGFRDDGIYNDAGPIVWGVGAVSNVVATGGIKGIDLDKGADAGKFRSRISKLGAHMIGAEMDRIAQVAFNSVSLDEDGLPNTAAGMIAWFQNANPDHNPCVVTPAAFATIMNLFGAVNIIKREDVEAALGVAALEVVSWAGEGENCVLFLPYGTFGLMARVPKSGADWIEEGTITDDVTGLTVGIKVGNDQAHNGKFINIDAWLCAKVLKETDGVVSTFAAGTKFHIVEP